MKLRFICPKWGNVHIPTEEFLKKVKTSGYDGIEIDLPINKHERDELMKKISASGLEVVAQHWETNTRDFNAHKRSFIKHISNLAEANPLLINSHTGHDFFSFEQNMELLRIGREIEMQTGITITHETHRSRFSYAAHVCKKYLERLSWLKLTADFSHWTCVSESMLENQPEALNLGILHTHHIHARVGSSQSPQVVDPKDSNYDIEMNTFMEWWKAMYTNAIKKGLSQLTITPEYGPLPYALRKPYSNTLLADPWEVNMYIKTRLKNELKYS